MMVASGFDLWQKDPFFSVADEVQESTDIMESVYRTWLRERREGMVPDDSEELRRELQITLGTAKWQLEELDRAFKLSYGNRSEHNKTARHKKFIAAIEDQISRVEKALSESLYKEGKQTMRWVNLDEGERNEFASFLPSTPGTLQGTKDENVELRPSSNNPIQVNDQRRKVAERHVDAACRLGMRDPPNDIEEVPTFRQDAKYAIALEAKQPLGTKDDLSCQADKSNGYRRRTWSTPSFGAWNIVIPDEDKQKKPLGAIDESPFKGNGFTNSLRKQKNGEHLRAKGGTSNCLDLKGINSLYQGFGWLGGSQRQIQDPQHMQFRYLKLTFVAALTIFLIVPLVVHAM